MALVFRCPHCNSEVVVSYLNTGEEALCKHCGRRARVPSDAEEREFSEEELKRIRREANSTPLRNTYSYDELSDVLAAHGPESLRGTVFQELLAQKLTAGEKCLSWAYGVERADNAALCIPFIGTILEAQKRFYFAALTDRRLLVVQLGRTFMGRGCREKRTLEYGFPGIRSVSTAQAGSASCLTILTGDGDRFDLRDVDSAHAAHFEALFRMCQTGTEPRANGQ